jgi:malate-CoA ligase subunit beta
VWAAADELLGKKLITHQTGPQGKVCHRLYIEEGCNIAREIYLAFVLDRAAERVVVVASAEGGMEIEQLAVEKPESIIKIYVEPAVGMQAFQARELAFALGLEKSQINQAVTLVDNICIGRQPDHFFSRIKRSPSPARRATISNSVIAISAVQSVNTSGVFVTTTPTAFAASVSILLKPTPKLHRTLHFLSSTSRISEVI